MVITGLQLYYNYYSYYGYKYIMWPCYYPCGPSPTTFPCPILGTLTSLLLIYISNIAISP